MLTKSDRAHDLAILFLMQHPFEDLPDDTPEEKLRNMVAQYEEARERILILLSDS